MTEFPNDYAFWDSWYLYSEPNKEYHALMLCAERKYFPESTHHQHSMLAYARSRDLSLDLEHWEDKKIVKGLVNDPNSSIWTGSVICWGDGYLLAYTLRRTVGTYFAEQSICFARSDDLMNWEPVGEELSLETIDPQEEYFSRRPTDDDRTAHAWRDPYFFLYDGDLYMTVSAKSREIGPRPKKRGPGRRACIALLRGRIDGEQIRWGLVNPYLVKPGYYEELEASQVYLTNGGLGSSHRVGMIQIMKLAGWAETDRFRKMTELARNTACMAIYLALERLQLRRCCAVR